MEVNQTIIFGKTQTHFNKQKVILLSILGGWSKKMKIFHIYVATLCNFAASTDKNPGNESKNHTKSKYFIFSMYIFNKLTL